MPDSDYFKDVGELIDAARDLLELLEPDSLADQRTDYGLAMARQETEERLRKALQELT